MDIDIKYIANENGSLAVLPPKDRNKVHRLVGSVLCEDASFKKWRALLRFSSASSFSSFFFYQYRFVFFILPHLAVYLLCIDDTSDGVESLWPTGRDELDKARAKL